MKVQKRSFIVAALVAGFITLIYAPKANAAGFIESVRDFLGYGTVEQSKPATNYVVARRRTTTVNQVNVAPIEARENIGTIENNVVTRVTSTNDLTKATLVFVSTDGRAPTVQATVEAGYLFTIKDGNLVGFNPNDNTFIFFQRDENGMNGVILNAITPAAGDAPAMSPMQKKVILEMPPNPPA